MKKLDFKIIYNHLHNNKNQFIPSLDSYTNILEYSKKLSNQGIHFTKLDNKLNILKGLIVAYDNSKDKIGWITNVSVDKNYQYKGIASKLLQECITYFKEKKYNRVMLEVHSDNNKAIKFYKKHNFKIYNMKEDKLTLEINLNKRNYDLELKDTEDHKYAYNFDFDVMHPYYMKASSPYLNYNSNCLELGSSKGHFTKHILKKFNNVTCVEASKDAIKESKIKFHNSKKNIIFHNSLFENTILPQNGFDNIFLTHVLEHIENPITLLKQINKWLTQSGSFILICPNANAPSRQIAVKMGLIPHSTAVTESEKKHGHYRTYTLDTLEADAKKAGLNVIVRTGIFFKSLANFQWDELLKTNIISKEYLDGCFSLGQQYPDLCSSIMLVCKKGKI